MASIRKIETKNGFYYRITVSEGRTAEYKQIRHYKTWRPPDGMGARQAGKIAKQIAAEFENEIDGGFKPDMNLTFAEYVEHALELKKQNGARYGTIYTEREHLKYCLPKLGHLKLQDIKPRHLNELYKELSQPGNRKILNCSNVKVDLSGIVAASGKSKTAFAECCGVTFETLRRACDGGTISLKSAEKIAAYIGSPVDDVFTIDRTKTALSPKTINNIHRCLHSVLRLAETEMIIKYNPADKVAPPKVPRKTQNYFQPEQINKILDALETEPIMWRVFVTIMIVTGARRGEVAALRWEKIDFDKNTVTINSALSYYVGAGIQEGPTKTGNTRFITLPPEIMALLRKYRLWQTERRLSLGDKWKDTDYLFTQHYGGAINPSSANVWLSAFVKRHDLPRINPHAFRHSAASIMISSGCDIISVANILGHANPKVTLETYSHQITESTKKAAECLTNTILKKKA